MNLNYLFNIDYFKDFTYAHFNDCNKRIIEQQWEPSTDQIYLLKEGDGFYLETIYPGLLIGLGDMHGVDADFTTGNSRDGAGIKLGFTLDYNTGLPVIPGSSVKGVLRNAFSSYSEYVADELGIKANQTKAVKDIEQAVFGEGSSMGKVVFFDAIPVKANKEGYILGLENITPHNKPIGDSDYAYNGLKNPVPLTLLKVIPGVRFLFRFGWEQWDSAKQEVTKESLKNVFQQILIDLGIGAKTNVGFGVLAKPEDEEKFECWLHPKGGSECTGSGKCEICGGETGLNKKTGKYHKYCQKHNPAFQKKR